MKAADLKDRKLRIFHKKKKWREYPLAGASGSALKSTRIADKDDEQRQEGLT